MFDLTGKIVSMLSVTKRRILSMPLLALAATSAAQSARAAEAGLAVVTDIPLNHPRVPYFERMNAALRAAGYPATLNPGTTVFAGLEGLEAVKAGKADLAWMNASHLEAVSPALGVINLPFQAGDDLLQRPGVAQRATMFLDSLAVGQGVRVLGLMRGADQIFIFKERQPASLKDMAGLRIRVAGPGIYERILQGLGAQPVVLPIPRMKAAFDSGTLDGVFTSPGAWVSQIGMDAPNALRVPGLMMITYALVADAGRFASLGGAAEMASQAVREQVTEQWRAMREDDERLLAGMEAKGARIAVADPAPWRARVAHVLAGFDASNPGVMERFGGVIGRQPA